MAKKQSKKKTQKVDLKNSIINIVVLLAVIMVTVYAVCKIVKLVVKPTDIVMIETGVLSSEERTTGYIVRDETILRGESSQNIIPMKMEGEKAATGEKVFRYSSNNEETLKNKIDELDKKIKEALEGKLDIFPSDIKALDNQIEGKIDSLKLSNNMQEISEYKKDINKYITKKAKIAGDLSPAGSYINDLIAQKTNYENEIYSGSEYMVAKTSGIISYRVDNLENILTINSLDTLNRKTLDGLNLKTGQIVTSSSNIGKVVNNFVCYIVANVKSEDAKNVKKDKKVKLRLSTGDEVPAIIYGIREDEDGSLFMVFKTTECVEKLIDYRKITIDIVWWEYEGLKVPNSAIVYDNGLAYVVKNRAGYLDKILIEILKENENYCIVDNYKTEDLKALNFTASQINSMKKISIYDEIVLSPDLDKIN